MTQEQKYHIFNNIILSIGIIISSTFVFFGLNCLRNTSFTESKRYKNVIILIPDGCGVAHMTIARWFKGSPLCQDSMDVSLVHTWNVNTMITGSASAATAYATGYKTWEDSKKTQCLSMLPDSHYIPVKKELPPEKQFHPVATLLEGARLKGKATGIISTSRISHATPAAFSSHWHDRGNDNVIIKQQVFQGIDVVFGGGLRYLVDKSETLPSQSVNGKRKDGENLLTFLRQKNYTFVTDRDELLALTPSSKKVWGLFNNSHMKPSHDRDYHNANEPSLAEMTAKAIEILAQDPDGFFLMVEGSQVDWASHDNDAFGVATEYQAFDDAVSEALAFAKADPEKKTLVLVVPDHDNGGMSLGIRNMKYESFLPEDCIRVLKKAKLTAATVTDIICSKTNRFAPDQKVIQEVLEKYYGINDLTAEEMDEIIAEFGDTIVLDSYGTIKYDSTGAPITDSTQIDIPGTIGPILSRRAGIGWTTWGHTGHDVPLFSYGLHVVPQTIQNSDCAHLCAEAMGFSLDSMTARLFCDVKKLLPDAVIELDTTGVNNGSGSVIIQSKNGTAHIPFHKNMFIQEGDTVTLEGLAIYSANTHRAFVPRQIKTILKQ